MIELFRQKSSTKQEGSMIQLPHLFVGQLKPIKTDSRVNLSILGIFASCVIIFSSIVKKAVKKSVADSKNPLVSSSAVVSNEQQYFGQLERTFRALKNLKSAIGEDAEHASDLFLKLLQEAPMQKLSTAQVTSQSLERVITDILKEVDKKLRYYHSLFTILEKFSQQAVTELETNLKEASVDDALFEEIMQHITNDSYSETKKLPNSASELYEQIRKNDAVTPISQKCEQVRLDITRMKRTLQFTLTKLQDLKAASFNRDTTHRENRKQVNGVDEEMEPQEWLHWIETKADSSTLASLKSQVQTISKDQQWTFLSSLLEKAYSTVNSEDLSTESCSVQQLIQKKDEEIAFLRQRLAEVEQARTKTPKARTRASKSSSNSENTKETTKPTSKRNKTQKKVEEQCN
ncbi:hypothetical protein GAYE_SCF03G2301 [Galdieria yellowstonensis]|uniref:Uncharacterized protein n=1 Tax=Galdieria yellowstonensis TaxID=3028027 RepID=A0AAV9IAE4_9RHOD|nr:hypothetical protein GAYE_SCF03G2301 [Galdieria yellowstonensis]